MLAYALTIFLGAFLLFQVQPLIGKYILPWFGGGPGVWTTCMLFFQVVLLGGYAYAHLISRCLRPRSQAGVHLLLLLGALALAYITPGDSCKPDGTGNPTVAILALLTTCLGLPYFVLSTTGPLLQHWFSRTKPDVSPYRLYALSNVGSLLALISYPFLFEPLLTRKAQAVGWAGGFVAYVFCCGFCAVKLWQVNPAADDLARTPASIPPPSTQTSALTKLLWLLLPACASLLLLAVTNKLCQDVAVIPFLWVLPLALYLLSFVICFDNPRWYQRTPFVLALIAAMVAICWALFQGTDAPLRAQVVIYAAGLFACCMVCHGELYRLRPAPNQLTSYYLMISAGGALGGLFVALAAPRLFNGLYELHWGLLLCGLLLLVICCLERTGENVGTWRRLGSALTLALFGGFDQAIARLASHAGTISSKHAVTLRLGMWAMLALILATWIARGRFQKFRHWRLISCLWLSFGIAALAVTLHLQVRRSETEAVYRSRNFYGTLAVCEYRKSDPLGHYYLLQHGRITHGIQFTDPERSRWPTSYYCEGSGVALAMAVLPAGPRHIGVIGLGTGTMAAFGRAGDSMRLYEINPEVQRLATSRFTYLSNSPAHIEVVMGDARLSLEREPPQQFDLLALDAFSSDAVPVHLLTKEAFDLYDRHMKPGGIIAVHISNRYIDLEPVVVNLARAFDYRLAIINLEEDEEGYDEEGEESRWWRYASTWVLLSQDSSILNAEAIQTAATAVRTNLPSIPLWTDDFASVFQVLK